MAFIPVIYKGKPLTVHKAITSPNVEQKIVLVANTWDYVDLWLRRSGKEDARFYWQQARHFYEASRGLPKTASPLTTYYCFLNATKALLVAKGAVYSDSHGVSGETTQSKTSLANEWVTFKTGGILAALCRHLGEPAGGEKYTLKDILYNLAYVHRAFALTYQSAPELFIPVSEPRIVRSTKTHEAWLVAGLTEQHATTVTVSKLPKQFERELSGEDKQYLIRTKDRFDWRPRDKQKSLERYRTFHRKLRRHMTYIAGPQRLWYIKRSGPSGVVERSELTLAFAAMHKLSELARYAPETLAKHYECQHNWLLSEFVESAPVQFIDLLSSEMTGREFMSPGRASSWRG